MTGPELPPTRPSTSTPVQPSSPRAAVRVPLPERSLGGRGACGARLFSYTDAQGAPRRGLVVLLVETSGASRGAGGRATRERVFAYENRCPHAGYALDLGDDDVCDPTGRRLMCMVHGAVFRPEDGRCVGGPGEGAALTPLRCHREGDEVVVEAGAAPVGTGA